MKGWGVGALAGKVGSVPGSLWRIETGAIKAPRPHVRRALAKALGVKEADPLGKVGL
jgi:hypothetical protein